MARLACWLIFALGFAPYRCAAAPGQEFRIAGSVVDEISRTPLARATVRIAANFKDKPFVAAVQTDSEGRFVFENLEAGKYSLSAERRGHGTQRFQQHENYSTAIAVGRATDSEHIVFGLLPQAAISGQVTDDATGPVREAEVLLFRKSRYGGRLQVNLDSTQRTDDEGHYRFAGLQPGTYYVAVSTRPWYAQFAVPTMHIQVKGPNGENLDFNLREALSVAGASYTVARPGTALAEGLSALEAVRDVTNSNEATDQAAGAAIAVISGSEPPSALEVVYPMTYFQDATDAARAAAIALRPGDSGIADFNLHAVPAVRMRIRTHNASPAGESPDNTPQIEYTQRGLGNYNARIATEEALVEPGILEVSGLPPGPVAMRVGGADSGTVEAGRTTDFDASENAGTIAIRGTLQLEDGSAFREQGAVAFRDRASGEIRMADYSKDATLELRSPAGATVAYEVSLVNSELAVKSVAASGAKASGQTVEVSGTQDVRLTIRIANATASIKGVVLRDEKPVPGAMILLAPEDAEHNVSQFRQEQSGSDGTFSMSGVMAGRYTLVAIEDGWNLDWADARVLAPYLAGGERLNVETGHAYDVKVKALAAQANGARSGSQP